MLLLYIINYYALFLIRQSIIHNNINIIHIITIIMSVLSKGHVLHCKRRNPGCSSAEGRSFTAT